MKVLEYLQAKIKVHFGRVKWHLLWLCGTKRGNWGQKNRQRAVNGEIPSKYLDWIMYSMTAFFFVFQVINLNGFVLFLTKKILLLETEKEYLITYQAPFMSPMHYVFLEWCGSTLHTKSYKGQWDECVVDVLSAACGRVIFGQNTKSPCCLV